MEASQMSQIGSGLHGSICPTPRATQHGKLYMRAVTIGHTSSQWKSMLTLSTTSSITACAHEWNHNAISQSDTNPDGLAHLGWQSLDAAGALGLVYHYLSSAMPDLSSRYSLSSPPQSAATGHMLSSSSCRFFGESCLAASYGGRMRRSVWRTMHSF